MKKYMYFLCGCLVTAIIMSSYVVFADTSSRIDVIFGRIKLMVDGEPVDKETLLYNNTTYVPLRTVAEALDKEVVFDSTTQTAYIDEKGTNRKLGNSTDNDNLILEIPRSSEISPEDYIKFHSSEYINAYHPSGSMENTIMPGDEIFADKNAYNLNKPKRFDIVVLQLPDDENLIYVKRIIGLPNEKLEIKNGLVYINGSTEPLDEPYVKEPSDEMSYESYQIPENHYFVLGDNRDISSDSRYWMNSYVKFEDILGKVVFISPPSE